AKDGIEAVRTHVPQRATAEISPSSPGKWQVTLIERAFRRWAEPQVPIESRGHGILLFWTLDPLEPEWAARPILYFANWADCARPDPFAEKARIFRSLISDGDLRGNSGFLRHFSHAVGFIDRVRQRLLTEHVFAFFHGRNRRGCVKIVSCADDHRVQIFLLFEQFAEVNISSTSFILFRT